MQQTYTTVGVTGHIDHGKTSLVGKLTGIETDTHPEEKQRGITIDLGFASMTAGDHVFAFIDAPGHQKYVGNLLAGVSAVDIGLLVVACDQGIQEQTLEHAAVLQTLGVPRLIVALSRIDLCDRELRDSVTEELQVFLTDYGFEDIPVIQVSSVTGEGIEQMRKQLCQAANQTAPKEAWRLESPFRMPIDRVLNVPGRGLVVAGTIWSGRVQLGDQLRLLGDDQSLRVREIEVHGHDVEESRCGVRTALNLSGTAPGKLARGDELLGLDAELSAQKLLVNLKMAPNTKQVRCPATVQLHSATTSAAARLTGPKQLAPGEQAVVVVELSHPIAAEVSQACLFRLPYPIGTFGGGRVSAVLPTTSVKRKLLSEFGERILNASASERLVAWVDLLGELKVTPAFVRQQLGVSERQIEILIEDALDSPHVLQIGDQLVSSRVITRLKKFSVGILTEQANTTDNAWLAEDSVVEKSKHLGSPEIARAALKDLIDQGELVSLNGMLAVTTEKTQLSKKQRGKMVELLKLLEDTRSPPSTKELTQQLQLSPDAVNSLLRHATQQGILLQFSRDMHIASDVFQDLISELRNLFEHHEALSVPQIKDQWQLTRKHVIPLLEFCDREKYTSREQDVRRPGPRLAPH